MAKFKKDDIDQAIEDAAQQLKSEYSEDVWEEGALEFAKALKQTNRAMFGGFDSEELADYIYGACYK